SARDSDDERSVLDAVGAPPVTRRQVGTRRAVLLVVVACAISVPAALVPTAAVVAASTRVDAHFRLDWLALLAVVFLLPLVVAIAASVGGWVRDARRPTRPTAFAFAD